MEDQLNVQIETQDKITTLVRRRQDQLTTLKSYYDSTCTSKKYKNIIIFGPNLSLFSNLYSTSKSEYKFKCENILSLSTNIGKVLDLNNSAKTILLSLKILEEHRNYISNHKSYYTRKSEFVNNNIMKSNVIPFAQNHLIKHKLEHANIADWKLKRFYNALYSADADFFNDFKEYLNFQRDSRKKSNTAFKPAEFQSAIDSTKKSDVKFYTRMNCAFDLDWACIVNSACDIVFMLYNKMMDKICYNQYLLQFIKKVDEYIVEYFIKPCSAELQRLSIYIVEEEVKNISEQLERVYK